MDEVNRRKVFLSHAESDKKLAERIKELLKDASHGMIETWQSSSIDGVSPGDHVWVKIHEELGAAGKIIVVLTPVSCARPWLLWEAAYVAGMGRRQVIPLLCGVDREAIPDPLQAFKCYSARSDGQLRVLLTQLLTDLDLTPSEKAVDACVEPFCHELEEYLATPPVDSVPRRHGPSGAHSVENGFELTSRHDFSRHLEESLRNETVKTIQLITYTCEVDHAIITERVVRGKKVIEVYKRSILADLAEQQECNLRRLVAGSRARPWKKRGPSIQASEFLANMAIAETTIVQYFYEGPPTKRAYILDGREAITAYYETVGDPLMTGGSQYKGITESKALVINRRTPLGRFVLDELKSHMGSIRVHGRSWDEERRILCEGAPWRGGGRKPCVRPRAVFLDAEGVLFDSPRDRAVERVYEAQSKGMGRRGSPPPQSGAKMLVNAIADTKLEMWVVTASSQSPTAEQIKSDFDPLIRRNRVITPQDARAGQTDPDPFLWACQRAEVHPHESVAIASAPLRIESADRAGTFCIAVSTAVPKEGEAEAAGARVVFPSCEKLASSWSDVVAILCS